MRAVLWSQAQRRFIGEHTILVERLIPILVIATDEHKFQTPLRYREYLHV